MSGFVDFGTNTKVTLDCREAMILHGLHLVDSVERGSLTLEWHVDSHIAAPVFGSLICLDCSLFEVLVPDLLAIKLVVYNLEGQSEPVADPR